MKIALPVLLCLHAVTSAAVCNSSAPVGYTMAMTVNWAQGMPPSAGVQGAKPESILVRHAANSARASLHVQLSRSDSFANVPGGTPRAEVSLGSTRFENGTDYVLVWSTMIPDDFRRDTQQPEIITQIHQGLATGSPPFALLINNDHYEVNVRSDDKASLRVSRFGNVGDDRGRFVCWRLHYVPDGAGQFSKTELYEGDKLVYADSKANAYLNDKEGYLKLGVYKWLWATNRSDVTRRSMDFGNVYLYRRAMQGATATNEGQSR